jgi:GR25 family glycosyltransferase involved in LPS biosynthesis
METLLVDFIKEYKHLNISIKNSNDLDKISKSKINEKVSKIYVINLFEDIRKRNYINVLFKKYKIDYNLIIVDRINKTVYEKLLTKNQVSEAELGCLMSHMWCLMDIIKNKYENAIIFEDDVILSKTFINSFVNIFKIDPKIDFLMLGAHDYNFNERHYKNVKNGLYRPDNNFVNLFGAHANYYSNKGAQKMFNIRATNLSFFDDNYNLMFNSLPNSYICYPNLAIANVSESTINHEKKFFTDSEIGYYNLCFNNINLNNYNLIYTNILDLSLLSNDDNVNTFINKCIRRRFNDNNKASFIFKRFVLDFFTINDIKKMLSKKCLIMEELRTKGTSVKSDKAHTLSTS